MRNSTYTLEVVCLRLTPLCKGAVRAAVDLGIHTSGGAWIFIRNFTLHERDGKRWVQGPVQVRKGQFAQLISWKERAMQASFQRAAIQAIDSYEAGSKAPVAV